MIIWALVLVIINYVLLLGILWHFPSELYYWNTLVSMLIALGMFYRIRTKVKEGKMEKLEIQVEELKEELNKCREKLTQK